MDYKKILEGVVDIINTTEKSDIGFANICAYIGENCPELKESEDESIRKDIVFYIAAYHKDDGEKARWLYWLEKQGGHAKFISGIQVGDRVTRNEDGVLVNLSQLNRVAKKQGEQKPADKVEPKFKVGDVMRTLQEASDGFTDGMPVVVSIDDEYYNCTNELIAIKDQDDYEYPPMNRRQKPADEVGNYDHKEVLQTIINEQKPAWSEEDEKIIRDIHCFLDYRTNCHLHDQETKERAKKIVSWLDELKNRVLPQPKQEWSEEDERLREYCINAINGIHYYSPENKQELVGWLKSLRPQKQWKPSLAQLNALSIVSKGCAPDDIEAIVSLYNDLKKLREE